MNGNGDFWENRAELGNYPATVKGLLLEPAAFFQRMGAEAPLGPAMGFGLISFCLAAVLQIFWNLVFAGIKFGMLRFAGEGSADGPAAIAPFIEHGVQIGFAILTPAFGFIGIFVGAGITHLCLLLLGGVKEGYPAMVKIFLYANAGACLGVVPCLGDFAYAVWSIVISTVGIVTVHKTETWRALLAIFLPTILICLCCAVAIAIIAGVAGAGALTAFGPLQEILRNIPRG
jgi:hypothetical protein